MWHKKLRNKVEIRFSKFLTQEPSVMVIPSMLAQEQWSYFETKIYYIRRSKSVGQHLIGKTISKQISNYSGHGKLEHSCLVNIRSSSVL